ncbi:MAG: 50S ribosomal protein L15e [Candidatus Altiarchaeota archaeon]
MGYQKYVKALYKNKESMKQLGDVLSERKMRWRREPPIVRVEHPTRPDKARQYGYRAKQGFLITRVKVRRGGLRKARPSRGRKPAGMGVSKITAAKSTQRMAEERAQQHYTNMQTLASYWVLDDGRNKWYEVIMVDPHHPAIINDPTIGWLARAHKGRVFQGLTPAGKKGRGLRNRGKGAEKIRPSLRAQGRKGK